MLDREGIACIESGSFSRFVKYLQSTRNTVCGRHAIGVVLSVLEELGGGFKFVKYAQSGKVTSPSDSSVSYASAYATFSGEA